MRELEIIDVTLRDGGHAVDFDWPLDFARLYYDTLSEIPQVKTIELGYWGQTSKTTNTFYNLDIEKVNDVTRMAGNRNVSIMIDYHYCSHDVENYPTNEQSDISMIRMCSRKEDIENAVEFGKELKKFTGINVSFNIFNASNYTQEELSNIADKVVDWPFDYIYLADTHGDLDLSMDLNRFDHLLKTCKNSGKRTGFHLHDHSGKAMINYRELLKQYWMGIRHDEYKVDSTDTSVRGMGKGSGNLKLEYVLHKEYLPSIANLIGRYQDLLTIHPSPYELITAKYAITDNYAKMGAEKIMDIFMFDEICGKLSGCDKDNFNPSKLEVNDG